ncbi:predicted protein [Botrytis cinerea T4]|uniref:Uncharacterized protein n=1 Tax=Botryotinia fuckeliana (strain T4) TaxID=999810 RepID=G2YE69_BOTF4|nr:predicted protein [Botrytis cinerea T4]
MTIIRKRILGAIMSRVKKVCRQKNGVLSFRCSFPLKCDYALLIAGLAASARWPFAQMHSTHEVCG